jgi:hypothetical protein
MSKEIPASISFNSEIGDMTTFIKEHDQLHYNGDLEKWINSRELIWINEHLLVSLNRIATYKKWLDNYEALCIGFHNRRNEEHIANAGQSDQVRSEQSDHL